MLALRSRRPLLLLGVAAALFLLAAPARADGFLVPTRPDRPVRADWAVEEHVVDVQVRGPHAAVQVQETFVNLGSSRLEAEYVFPLPRGAMVSAVTLFEDGRALEGRLLRAEEARRIYEGIVRRQKDPALLEYLGQDLFRVSVFPLPPGGRRKVVLSYEQLLPTDAGTVELVYPLATEKHSARPLQRASVAVDLVAERPLGPIYSPSHDVAVTRRGPKAATISWESAGTTPDTDFVLYWSHTDNAVGATLLTHWPAQDDRGYFLFLASPVAGDEARAAQPKQITLVVDTSGSMAGDKIEQVRAALRQVIAGLNANDRFNVIAYHAAALPLWDGVQPVSEARRREALAFVDGLKAQGGTNIQQALQVALAGARPEPMAAAVLFLTDGRPTVGERDTDAILAAAGQAIGDAGTRVFTFGVGVDVDTVLLDRIALEHGGVPTFVRPAEDVEPKVASLYDKIRHPVLTGLSFAMKGGRVTELLPETLPDLFRGGQVVLAGRYAGDGRVECVLTGRDGQLLREFHSLQDVAGRGEGLASDFPARVWATRRIGQLVDEIRLQKREDAELVEEIVRLSTRFGILTEYTAFLADDAVDHTRLALNSREAWRRMEAIAGREVGGVGFAQSSNQNLRRGADRAPKEQTFFLPDASDRDVEMAEIDGVRQVGNRTFFRRGRGWVDAALPSLDAVDETVARWTPRFFELLATTTAEENARLAQRGTLVLEVQGRILRIVDPS